MSKNTKNYDDYVVDGLKKDKKYLKDFMFLVI